MLRIFPITLLLSGIFAVSASAQTEQLNPNRSQSNDPNARNQTDWGDAMDQKVGACLVLANANEIALAEFAQGRVQDDRVKKFVNMIITDHEKSLEKAKQYAPAFATVNRSTWKDGRTNSDAQSSNQRDSSRTNTAQNPSIQTNPQQRDDGNRADQSQTDRNRDDRTAGSDRSLDQHRPDQHRTGEIQKKWFEIERNAGERAVQMMVQELEQVSDNKSDNKFDKAWLASQVGGHILLVSKLQAMQPHVSEQMRPFIAESLTSAQRHLEEARNLCKSMEESQGQQARRQTSSTN